MKKRFQGNSETWQVQVGQLTTWQDVVAEGRPIVDVLKLFFGPLPPSTPDSIDQFITASCEM